MQTVALIEASVQPAGRPPAPEPLELVQAFVNTVDREHGPDLLDEPEDLAKWAHRRGFAVPADVRHVREVREALRALLWVNSGATAEGRLAREATPGRGGGRHGAARRAGTRGRGEAVGAEGDGRDEGGGGGGRERGEAAGGEGGGGGGRGRGEGDGRDEGPGRGGVGPIEVSGGQGPGGRGGGDRGEDDGLRAAIATLDAAAAGLRARFDPPRLEGDGIVETVLGVAFLAMADGSWSRLKACPGERCGWAFYDRSVNASATWCSMRICGNRAKTRSYYRRTR